MRRPRTGVLVKVCGITRVEDARLAVELGAGFLGFNFFPDSPRYLSPARAAEIARAVGEEARLVGVFVNARAEEIDTIADRVGLDLAQLHGDESPDLLDSLSVPAIKAFRLSADAAPPDLAAWERTWGFLFEARRKGFYGGGGRAWAYERMAGIATDKPAFVAGGVQPETARRAIELSRASGVDVCSGVEAAPGIKDRELLEAFFRYLDDGDGGAVIQDRA